MERSCPIDEKCSLLISALLTSPNYLQLQEYFQQLLASRHCHALKITQNPHFGKGVFADVDFKEDELILKDQMLVGAQHSANKFDCMVCGFCFRFIGSIELQIGRKLYLQSLGESVSNGCDNHDRGECSSSNAKDRVPLPREAVESLMNDGLTLPYSDKFPLPSPVSCFGGCGEVYYCRKLCAEADWEHSHSLLCTGERSKSHYREALSQFIQHANETNDIFLLAAKTIAFIILRYRKLKAAYLAEESKHSESGVMECLLEAWKPVSFGHKKRWWDCISLPDDVDSSDENAFRTEVKDLAFTSLQLLKAAIFDQECEPLFSLEIYGNIIGMFELNNLDLVVASPVEDYFLYIDDLPQSEKIKIDGIMQPLLNALGDDYSVCCQGTAFYPLQSCMNHSCDPNAKAFKREEDRDGQATILALRAISKGEEVTISYINEQLPFEERQAALADYGFKCRCTKCLQQNTQTPLDPNSTCKLPHP